MSLVAGSYVFNGDVNERAQTPRCCKWVTSQYWQEVTALCQEIIERLCRRWWWLFEVTGTRSAFRYSCGDFDSVWDRFAPDPEPKPTGCSIRPWKERYGFGIGFESGLWGLSSCCYHRLWCLWRSLGSLLSNIFCRHDPDLAPYIEQDSISRWSKSLDLRDQLATMRFSQIQPCPILVLCLLRRSPRNHRAKYPLHQENYF